jgi:hypothetical protein
LENTSTLHWALEILKLAKDSAKRLKNVGSEFYVRKLDLLVANPDKASEILSPASAPQLIEKKSVVNKEPKFRIEQTLHGQILWVPHSIKQNP